MPVRDGPGWSDLPGDLLAAVYQRSASAFDRARFAAVCTSWRAVAAWHPRLPAMPLLLPSTGDGKKDMEVRAYSPEDGRVLRVPLPWFPAGNRLVGSYKGGWIATASGSKELLVVNLFSGARTALSVKQRFVVCACPSSFWGTNVAVIRKLVFSADPSSSSCILAAITNQCNMALCRVGCLDGDGGWTTQGCGTITNKDLIDITFCNGELYGFTYTEMFTFDIGLNEDGAPVANPIHRLEMSSLDVMGVSIHAIHIFELCGKLAIAVEAFPERGGFRDSFFKVYELAEGNTMWEELTTLGDHALFLGRASSKAVHVSMATGKRGAVKGNHIYYFENYYQLNHVDGLARLEIGSCVAQCKGTHHLEKILSHGYLFGRDENGNNGCNSSIWLWPPDF